MTRRDNDRAGARDNEQECPGHGQMVTDRKGRHLALVGARVVLWMYYVGID